MIASGKPKQLCNKIMQRNTREGNMLRIQGTPRLAISGSNLLEKGVKLWNLLPNELKETQSTPAFKRASKSWVKANIPIKPG